MNLFIINYLIDSDSRHSQHSLSYFQNMAFIFPKYERFYYQLWPSKHLASSLHFYRVKPICVKPVGLRFDSNYQAETHRNWTIVNLLHLLLTLRHFLRRLNFSEYWLNLMEFDRIKWLVVIVCFKDSSKTHMLFLRHLLLHMEWSNFKWYSLCTGEGINQLTID